MGFIEVLTLILITLKLTGQIDWSWWGVFTPELFTLGFYVAAAIIATTGVLLISKRKNR